MKRKYLNPGQRFGKLTVTSFSHVLKNRSFYKCLCDCGAVAYIQRANLLTGQQSCGCLRKKHGKTKSPEFRVWTLMRSRCMWKGWPNFHNYGGRGITICDRWKNSFLDFLHDVGPRPSDRHSIDRIDNNGNYEPGNVRWATSEEQANNRRTCRFLEFNGKRQTVTQWAKQIGITHQAMMGRIGKAGSQSERIFRPRTANV